MISNCFALANNVFSLQMLLSQCMHGSFYNLSCTEDSLSFLPLLHHILALPRVLCFFPFSYFLSPSISPLRFLGSITFPPCRTTHTRHSAIHSSGMRAVTVISFLFIYITFLVWLWKWHPCDYFHFFESICEILTVPKCSEWIGFNLY